MHSIVVRPMGAWIAMKARHTYRDATGT